MGTRNVQQQWQKQEQEQRQKQIPPLRCGMTTKKQEQRQ
jgi:hypothetical protein